jgi:hypothetical protein
MHIVAQPDYHVAPEQVVELVRAVVVKATSASSCLNRDGVEERRLEAGHELCSVSKIPGVETLSVIERTNELHFRTPIENLPLNAEDISTFLYLKCSKVLQVSFAKRGRARSAQEN